MNKYQIINEQQLIISSRRADAVMKSDKALLLARQNPEFLAIDNERRKLVLDLSKIEANTPQSKEIEAKINDLNKLGIKVLKKANFDITSLTPHFTCTKCNDTGYIGNEMCSCLKQNIQNALLKQCGILKKLNASFDKSNPKFLQDNPKLDKIYKFAIKYCEDFPGNSKNNLVLYGEVGTGKTFLLECIASDLIKKLHYVVFTTAYDVCATMTKAFNAPYAERDAILSPLFESELLIIDDLGTEPLFHESTLTNLFTLINERDRNSLPLIISTNLSPEQIDSRYGDRIKSRLYNTNHTIAIKFEGDDLRLKKIE